MFDTHRTDLRTASWVSQSIHQGERIFYYMSAINRGKWWLWWWKLLNLRCTPQSCSCNTLQKLDADNLYYLNFHSWQNWECVDLVLSLLDKTDCNDSICTKKYQWFSRLSPFNKVAIWGVLFSSFHQRKNWVLIMSKQPHFHFGQNWMLMIISHPNESFHTTGFWWFLLSRILNWQILIFANHHFIDLQCRQLDSYNFDFLADDVRSCNESARSCNMTRSCNG
jgi:hypothetical protein